MNARTYLFPCLLLCALFGGCDGGDKAEPAKPGGAVVKLSPVHPKLPLAGSATVKLLAGKHAKQGAQGAPFVFPGLAAGDYPVTVEGPVLAAQATLKVDGKGNGATDVAAVPVVAFSLPTIADGGASPKWIYIDTFRPWPLELFWKQGHTVVAIAKAPEKAKLEGFIASQYKDHVAGHQDSPTQTQVVLGVGSSTNVARIEKLASAILSVSALRLLVVKRKDAQPVVPAPHAYEKTKKPEKEGRYRLGAISVAGKLTSDDVEAAVKKLGDLPHRCYWGGLAKNQNRQGRGTVRFVLGRDGRVSSVGGGGDLPDAEVTECVTNVFYRLKLKAPASGIVTAAVPIVFSP